MRATPTLLLATLLPLFAGCQMFADKPSDPNIGSTRMQGELSAGNGKLLFKPCNENRRFLVNDAGNTGLLQEADSLASNAKTRLFADLRGRLGGSRQADSDGQFDVQRLYRLERISNGCEDPNFKHLTLRAEGHSPDWDVKASGRGMIIDRAGKDALPLPFLEEEIPGGGLSLSSEANGQHVELWVAPQRCVEPASGAIRHLRAELRIDGQVAQGCAYFGGARDN
ncbi:hypothetical protein SJI00_12580 [Pseudomonas sp. RP23018S]|uniref:COG3650 family protein n=1 Tax=Pseudomonas sp. RP23018S TaxID=3096037 RepID=UPI002ACAAD0C|nr:hypothetical protein [Pseudomonas sp. RP23018S]MDZ5603611.1 hypothetical protein [Pseudomonas sp. RP23018S]